MPEKSVFKLQVFGNDAGKFPLDPEILFFPSQWWNSGAVRAGRLGRVSKLILLSENSGLEEDSSGWNGAKWPSMCLSYQASCLQASSGFTPWGSWTWAPSTKTQTFYKISKSILNESPRTISHLSVQEQGRNKADSSRQLGYIWLQNVWNWIIYVNDKMKLQ